jgi:predicted MPP superfamily phosphohydrolase
MARIIFFGIFFTVTGLISLYIYIRGLQSIPQDSRLRNPYTVIFWIVVFSFMGSWFLENILPVVLADLLVWVGGFWMGAMLYFLLAVVFLDVLRLINHFLPFFPKMVIENYAQAKYITSACILGLVGILLLGGHINSVMPRVKKLDLPIAKKGQKIKNLNIVAVSDIHMGTIVGRDRVNNIVNRINSLHPDLVLLLGDILDQDVTPVFRRNLGEALRNIESLYGVYAVTGNHEHIAGVAQACNYLAEHDIVVLRDQVVKVADSLYLIGREDLSSGRFGAARRKNLGELMAEVDRSYPVILMDHQPSELTQVSLQGIDLQLSGHTHGGQIWPLNYIVNSIYELAWGYRKIGDTHFYVTNGVGTWGPPIRIGSRPEIVQINLKLE